MPNITGLKKSLEFYKENNIKVIDLSPYWTDLNPFKNPCVIITKELNGRNFTTITSFKKELF